MVEVTTGNNDKQIKLTKHHSCVFNTPNNNNNNNNNNNINNNNNNKTIPFFYLFTG
jgi:hypothetical protein